MKTDFSKLPREEVEARITTMLMGEMPADEAAALMEFLSGDGELLRLHDELKATISLVEEATASAASEKISEGRREALLQSFKLVQPAELAQQLERPAQWRSWAALAAMVAFLMVIAGMLLPGLSKAKSKGSRSMARLPEESSDDAPPKNLTQLGEEVDLRGGGTVSISGAPEFRERGRVASKMPEPALATTMQPPPRPEIESAREKTVATLGAAYTLRYFSDGQAKDRADAGGVAGATKIELPSLNEATPSKVITERNIVPGESLDELKRVERVETLGLEVGKPADFGAVADAADTRLSEQKPPISPMRGSRMAGGQLAYTDTEAAAGNENFYEGAKTTRKFSHVIPGTERYAILPSAGVSGGGAIDPLTGLPVVTVTSDLFAKDGAAVSEANAPTFGFGMIESKTPGAQRVEGQSKAGRGVAAGDAVVVQSEAEGVEAGAAGAMGGGSMQSMMYYQSNPELMKRYFPQMYEMMQRGRGQAGAGAAPGMPGMAPPAMSTPEQQVALGSRFRMTAPAGPAPMALPSPNQRLARLGKKTEAVAEANIEARLEQLRDGKNLQSVELGRKLTEEKLVAADKEISDQLVLADNDAAAKKPATPAAVPQPEVSTAQNPFSTFSLNVSDVSFKLAAASLEKGLMPEAATVRSEEFINAFDYRDPEPQGAPVGFTWERARYPFAQGRDLLRFSVKTAASGRQIGRPLNVVLLLDNSGSMERADRVRILQECLRTLSAQLRPKDVVSVVAFARTSRLWVDGLPGTLAAELPGRVGNLSPEGGTNLEEAMKVAYDTARKHFSADGINRVVLLTDGAANLGDVEPESLKRKVEAERAKGIALDCFGIGWEGLNDELLETLSRNGDGRYGFVNTPEAAASEFAGQLAGALQVAASDVKVQVEWNPKRVTAYRQIGYAKHQLTKEQFRDNTVDAAEIGAAEAGNALYVAQVNAGGEGPLGTVRVRFKVPGTNDYREHEWPLAYEGAAKALENSSYPLRLAGTASAFSEWLVSSPYATEVTSDRLLTILSGVPEHFAPDPRPKKLEWMIRQAKSLAGK